MASLPPTPSTARSAAPLLLASTAALAILSASIPSPSSVPLSSAAEAYAKAPATGAGLRFGPKAFVSSPRVPTSVLGPFRRGRRHGRVSKEFLRCMSDAGSGERPVQEEIRRVASEGYEVREGDTVSLRYVIRGQNGNEVQSSENTGPMTFEVGVGNQVTNNPLFQGIDSEVLGLKLGEGKKLDIQGPQWNPDLMFKVPADHPEMMRLQGRYRTQGGLMKDEYVELINGQQALVLDVNEQEVTLDCNSAFAGNSVNIEFEVLRIEQGDGTPGAYRPPVPVS